MGLKYEMFQPSISSLLTRRRKRYDACGDFFAKVTGALISLRLLFRKKSCLRRLFACKCSHDGWARYQLFAGCPVALKILFISSSQSTTAENGFVAGLAGVPFLKFNNLLVISLDLETIGQTRAQFNQT